MSQTIEAHTFYSPPAIKIGEFDAGQVDTAIAVGDYFVMVEITPGVRLIGYETIRRFTDEFSYNDSDHPELWEKPFFEAFLEAPRSLPGPSFDGVDKWHVDTHKSGHGLPNPTWEYVPLVLASTQFPTDTLTGTMQMPKLQGNEDITGAGLISAFLTSDEGVAAVDEAITRGDMMSPDFETGDILFLPRMALHRRNSSPHAEPRVLFKAQKTWN